MEWFVYGTLTDPGTAASVLDSFSYRGSARLVGLHRVDGTYPTLAPGGEVDGRILETDEVATLDHYEGVESGLYVRVSVPRAPGCEEADGTVATYVGDPRELDAPATWPGTGSFRQRVRAYVRAHEVSVTSETA